MPWVTPFTHYFRHVGTMHRASAYVLLQARCSSPTRKTGERRSLLAFLSTLLLEVGVVRTSACRPLLSRGRLASSVLTIALASRVV